MGSSMVSKGNGRVGADGHVNFPFLRSRELSKPNENGHVTVEVLVDQMTFMLSCFLGNHTTCYYGHVIKNLKSAFD